MACGVKASVEALHLWLTDPKVVTHELLQAWLKVPRQHQPYATVADDSPAIMDALLPRPSPAMQVQGWSVPKKRQGLLRLGRCWTLEGKMQQ